MEARIVAAHRDTVADVMGVLELDALFTRSGHRRDRPGRNSRRGRDLFRSEPVAEPDAAHATEEVMGANASVGGHLITSQNALRLGICGFRA